MRRLILVTFGFLGLAFYILSDGANFVPASSRIEVAELPAATPARAPVQVASIEVASDAVVIPAGFDPGSATLPLHPAKPTTSGDISTPSVGAPPVIIDATKMSTIQATTQQSNPTPEGTAEKPAPDLRKVTGNRVNMRMGPGTNYNVVTKLSAGTQVLVLQMPGEGWVKLRVVETGRVGWMADYLVSKASD
ncbi:SH3 domain-containing protein [Thalassovita taeanensis]|uniref:SH3 domain-containing protein n=1 Tax=Thalassovita taeanensis TaxID=657014 RepID=A0A1H9I1U9_9RHOB|nr:SH3 domain-containing protein [Thalassovita taeanensis]SEQ68513.1 SH3 domain-containing protein [Thalassovita taeanensis]